jgi:hypothetical protein
MPLIRRLLGWRTVSSFKVECSTSEIVAIRTEGYQLPDDVAGSEAARFWLYYHSRVVRYIGVEWGQSATDTAREMLPTADVLSGVDGTSEDELGYAADDNGTPWRSVRTLTKRRTWQWSGHFLAKKRSRAIDTVFPSLATSLEKWNSLPCALVASSLCFFRDALFLAPHHDPQLPLRCAWYLYQALKEEAPLSIRAAAEVPNTVFFAAMGGPEFAGKSWEEWKK